jgi:hypothetical protein
VDDDAGVTVADVSQDGSKVKGPGVQGAAQDDGAADLPGDRRDVVPGGLDGVDDVLRTGPQGSPVLGDGNGRYGPVEERHPELVLEARNSAGHSRLDDVHLAGGRGEAPDLAAGEEILKVADLHGPHGTGRAETASTK